MNTPKKILAVIGMAVLALLTVVIVISRTVPDSENASFNAESTLTKALPAVAVAKPPPVFAQLVVSTQPPPITAPSTAQPVAPPPLSPRDIVAPSPAPPVAVVTPLVNTESTAMSGGATANGTTGLHFASGPTDGLAIVQSYLNRAQGPNTVVMGAVSPDSLDIKQPLPIYTANVQMVANGTALGSLQTNGTYEYLIESSGRFTALCIVSVDSTGASRETTFGQAGLAQTLGSTLEQLGALDQVKAGSYEPRVIQLPGLFGSGVSSLLWLKSNTDSPDLICLPSTSRTQSLSALQAGKAYPAAEFFQLIQPIAQNRLGM